MKVREFEEYWPKIDSIEGWLNKDEAARLYELAGRITGDIVEIGSWKGRSSVCMGVASRGNSNCGKMVCVDPFTGSKEHRECSVEKIDTYEEFRNNLAIHGLYGSVEIKRMTSVEASKEYTGKIGLLFIDGSHEYEDVLVDFKSWRKFVGKGGWICFHDYNWPGVKQAVYECIRGSGYVVPKKTVGSLLCIRVR